MNPGQFDDAFKVVPLTAPGDNRIRCGLCRKPIGGHLQRRADEVPPSKAMGTCGYCLSKLPPAQREWLIAKTAEAS